MKKMMYLTTLVLTFSLNLTATPIVVPECNPGRYSHRAINYDKLRTKVRLCYGDNFRMHVGGLRMTHGYQGLTIMVETYNVTTHEPAWSGRISYGPKSGRPQLVTRKGQDSVVAFDYIPHSTYLDANRTGIQYSDMAVPVGDEYRVEGTDPTNLITDALVVTCVPRFESKKDKHHRLLRQAVLEWNLPETWSIQDIVHRLTALQVEGKYYPYSGPGTTASGHYMNCATFALKFLDNLGLNIQANRGLAGHLSEVENGNKWRFAANCVPILGTVVAGLFDAFGGAATPEKCLKYFYDSRNQITHGTQGAGAKVVRWTSHERNTSENTVLKQLKYPNNLPDSQYQDYVLLPAAQ